MMRRALHSILLFITAINVEADPPQLTTRIRIEQNSVTRNPDQRGLPPGRTTIYLQERSDPLTIPAAAGKILVHTNSAIFVVAAVETTIHVPSHVCLGFFKGDQLLKDYSSSELLAAGGVYSPSQPDMSTTEIKVFPGWTIRDRAAVGATIGAGVILLFDVSTGELLETNLQYAGFRFTHWYERMRDKGGQRHPPFCVVGEVGGRLEDGRIWLRGVNDLTHQKAYRTFIVSPTEHFPRDAAPKKGEVWGFSSIMLEGNTAQAHHGEKLTLPPM